jgi:hypothetical protein
MVMARLLRDEVAPTPEEFRRDVLANHRRLTAARSAGRWQVPWPRSLGTPPWAVVRELETLTGTDHDLTLARWSRAAAYERLALAGGALYVGSRALPRHVLLVLPPTTSDTGSALSCYQPSRGSVVTLPRAEFVAGRLRSAGWPYPWFTINPAAPVGPPGLRPPPG